MQDEFYMNLALQKAWKNQLLTYPNPAVGAVVLDNAGKILSIEAHEKAGFAHAEVLAVFRALENSDRNFTLKFLNSYNKNFNSNFKDTKNLATEFNANFIYDFIIKNHADKLKGGKIFVTLEPCSHLGKTPPCANLISALKFKDCVIGAKDENKIASGGAYILNKNGVNVKLGVCKNEAEILISPFKKWQKNGKFVFFKLALSANGVACGGIISNEKSRIFSHKLRAISDLLIIGGNTVRTDRPKLDTRLISGTKNPNIFIFSHSQNFDKTIPLFSVPNRNVEIGENIYEKLKNGLIMIEGGENFLREIKQNSKICRQIDYFLFFHSNKFKNAQNLKIDMKFNQIFSSKNDDENYGWYEISKF